MSDLERFAARLEHHLGRNAVIDDPDALEPLSRDESGDGPFRPDLAVAPKTPAQVRTCLALAADHRVAVTPRGAGTGKSGGALPVVGGAVLLLERMNRILDIDTQDLVAVVEPGVVLASLQEAVEAAGLFYPPDPSSADSCTLGGNVAENAGGPRAVKYGVTRSFVLGLELALMGGGKIEVGGRTLKDVSGYDLVSLLVGSEGTLAVVTRIQLRLLARPGAVAALWATYPSEVSAAGAVGRLLRSGLEPRAVEILDGDSLRAASAVEPPPAWEGAQAALLVELDGPEAGMDERIEACGELLESAGAHEVLAAMDAQAIRRLWAGRRHMSDTLKKLWPHKISEDVTVPVGQVGPMMARAREIAHAHGLECAIYGHAGDGNLHVNYLPTSHREREKALKSAVPELLQAALQHGGTLSGEHGIGISKRTWMVLRHSPPVLDAMRRLKAQWDPLGLLNPGKLLPPA